MGSEVEEASGVQGQNYCCGGWGQNPDFFISRLLWYKVGHEYFNLINQYMNDVISRSNHWILK